MSKQIQFKRAALSMALACGVAATALALAAAAFQVVIPLSISGQAGGLGGSSGSDGSGGGGSNPGEQEPLDIQMSLSSTELPEVGLDEAYYFDFSSLLAVTGDPDFIQAKWYADIIPSGMTFQDGVLAGIPDELDDEGILISITASYKEVSARHQYLLKPAGPIGWMHENGMTVMCPGAEDGAEFKIGDKTYRVVYSGADAKAYAATACTSNVWNMYYMFAASRFNEDISHWDTSNATTMSYMFYSNRAFNQDISAWDTSSVKSMQYMFLGAQTFNQDIGAWNTSNVTNMGGMFDRASLFDHDISEWNVRVVTNMQNMFNSAESFNQDLSGWCVPNVSVEPSGFSSNALAWEEEGRQPIWGTCPRGEDQN